MASRAFDKENLKELPQDPGVYIFLGEKEKILYIGKAKRLRSRVSSYLGKQQEDRPVTMLLHRYVKRFDFIVTADEKAALILENSMIKKHKPRFNVQLRDDKTYFSLRLDTREKWPWFRIVRKRRDEDGVLYFGPYTSATACRRTLQYLGSVFPLRTCSDAVLENRVRPCLSYEIKRCVAPCVDYIDRPAYLKIVDEAIQFMKGKRGELIDELRTRMTEAAAAMEYETAALLRDRIDAIETTVNNALVRHREEEAFDVVGIHRSDDDVDLAILFVRDGVMTSTATFRFPSIHSDGEILRSVLVQFYSGDRDVPRTILLPEWCDEAELIEEVLSENREAAVDLLVPERGQKKRLLELARRNAELAATQRRDGEEETQRILDTLQSELALVHRPERIECFDVSNLMGTHVVASCVAFRDTRPEKARYRRFKIKTVAGQDDFASMKEVLSRRLTRGLREDDLPDLIVIDGGLGQLKAACEACLELGVDSVDFIGLAKARSGARATSLEKQKERIFRPDQSLPIILDQKSPEMNLLVRIRDEAHRFAITYHRQLRAKAQVTSILELVPGIGKQKSRALLKEFGSAKALRAADDQAILAVKGMTPTLVARMREFFAAGGHLSSDELREDDTVLKEPEKS